MEFAARAGFSVLSGLFKISLQETQREHYGHMSV
jgi:hypothetical protein